MQPQAYAPQRNERPAWRRASACSPRWACCGQVRRQGQGAALAAAPKLKLFTTSASMLVSIGAYSLIWGGSSRSAPCCCCSCTSWGVIQLRREGIRLAPMFIPFLGRWSR